MQMVEDGFTPPALQNKPAMLPELQFAYSVYLDLRGSRNMGVNGPGQIPYSEYSAYARDHWFLPAEKQEIWQEVMLIDSIDLEIRYRESEKRTKKAKE